MTTAQIKDGWYLRFKEEAEYNIRGIISDGTEQDRVVNIVNDLLSDCHDDLWWYFSEDCEDSDQVYESIPDKLHTVYDSSWLNDQPDSGYNIVEIGYGEMYEGESFDKRDIFIALSMNGSSLSSALTEYYKFTIPVFDRYALWGIKCLVNAMSPKEAV